MEGYRTQTTRIAMWSGPRNISTAMMRSFGSRSDCAVCDEPFYAFYLATTGADHPGAAEVLAAQDNDWRKVVAFLTGPVPGGKALFYQKHMAHHLLPGISRSWLSQLTHAFLIRDPREMLLSLIEQIPDPTFEDTGLPQQLEIFRWLRRESHARPPVLDARDVLQAPQSALRRLCAALGIAFDESMLHWESGRRDTDGVWAPYWYGAVERSTGFRPWTPRTGEVPARLAGLHRRCVEVYEELYAQRIGGET